MRLRTRFIIAITATLTGFITISGLTVFLIMGINRLNRADTVCNDTINTLKQFQLITTQLLTTHELDKTFLRWKVVYSRFQDELDRLNTSREILDLLEAGENKNIIHSLNVFWNFTRQKTTRLESDLSELIGRDHGSRDGLIYQYGESNDHRLLVLRNTVYNALLFLEAEFEIKLSKLIGIVDQEKTKRFDNLIFQVSLVGLVIGALVSTILTLFLARLRTYLGTLHQTMERIGQGDFTKKLYIPGDDELSRIAAAVNKTSDALSDMHLELSQRLHENLLAKEKAETANRTKSIFLANISHEIRTPLNAVIGFSELLSSLVTDKKQKSYLLAIRKAGKSLLTLINDILDVSKIEADKLEITYAPFNLAGLLDDVEQVFSMQASKNNISFHRRMEGTLPDRIILDEIRLRQVLLNIVGNAVKFTDEGHITLSVNITDKQPGQTIDLHLSVEDTGMGIPVLELDRIFNSFEQQAGQDHSVYGGSGLGLTISKSLVKMMNGRIWVESQVGAGSTFHIVLRDVSVAAEERDAIPSQKKPPKVRFEPARVLVVDNVESHRRLMSSILAHANLETRTAINGSDAIHTALSWRPDLILMDIRMPVMDGISAARQLKENPETSHIPILAVSASLASDTPVATDAEGGPFDGSVPKPIDLERLMEELSRYLTTGQTDNDKNEQEDKPCADNTDFAEIIHILDKDFLPWWESFREQQPMAEVKAFGEQIKALGLDHDVTLLAEYGDNLIFYVDNFDVFNMQSTIDTFPRIIEKLNCQGDANHA